ncbi:18739_t:CDS:2, partial [Racocetra fulgida]
QQLKAARAKKHAKKPQEQLDYKDLVWSDQDIDKRASDYFSVLLMAGKNIKIWKPLESRTLMKVESIEVESMEFDSIEVDSIEVDSIEVETTEIELIEVRSTTDILAEIDIDKRIKMRLAIKKLDGILKKDDNQIDKEDIVQYRQTGFLLMMKELELILLEYCDEDLTILLENDISLGEK